LDDVVKLRQIDYIMTLSAYTYVGDWYTDYAIKLARWQQPTMGHGARLAVVDITRYRLN